MPDVTYVMAAHDSEDTIGAAIRSALAQENVSTEVVVVDDASTDRTAKVASLSDDRVRVVRLPRNVGPAGARNVGLGHATGDWVGILDSDDEIEPGRTRRMLDAAARSDSTAVVDNICLLDDAGRRVVMYSSPGFLAGDSLDLADYVGGNVMLDETLPYAYGYLQPLVRRDVLQSAGIRYSESMRIGEDFLFFAEVLAAVGSAAVDPEPGYRYRVRPDSVSSRLRPEYVRQMLEGDRRLSERTDLPARARSELARRTASLQEILDYLTFAEALKAGSAKVAWTVLRRHPGVVRHLSLPIRARLRRLRGSTPDR